MNLSRISLLGLFLLHVNTTWARSVTFDDSNPIVAEITIQLELCPDDGVTVQQMRDFIDRHKDAVEAIWLGNTGPLRTTPGGQPRDIHIHIEYSFIDDCDDERNPDKYRFRIHPGMPPASERRNAHAGHLYLGNTPRTIAHEIGHAFGLNDEYNSNGGSTATNLLGRGSSTTVTDNHLITIMVLHYGNPDAEELQKRRIVKALLRLYDRATARRRALETGVAPEPFDTMTGILDANGLTIQPPPP
jgi:hypothetical protein